MQDPSENAPASPENTPPETTLNCPSCQGPVAIVQTDQAQVVACPHCNQPFIVPAADGTTLPVARTAGEADEEAEDIHRDDLDGMRIRQITLTRRGANRSRSYLLMAVLLCIAAAGQLVFKAVWRIHATGWGDTMAVGYILGVPLALFVAYRFYRRSEIFRQEAMRSSLTDPAKPPDFSKLSDGSQFWKNLG